MLQYATICYTTLPCTDTTLSLSLAGSNRSRYSTRPTKLKKKPKLHLNVPLHSKNVPRSSASPQNSPRGKPKRQKNTNRTASWHTRRALSSVLSGCKSDSTESASVSLIRTTTERRALTRLAYRIYANGWFSKDFHLSGRSQRQNLTTF